MLYNSMQARGVNDWLHTVADCQHLIGSVLIQTRFPSHQLIHNKPFTQFPCAMDRITRPRAIFVHPRRVYVRVCGWECVSKRVCFLNEMVSLWTIIPVTGLGKNTHMSIQPNGIVCFYPSPHQHIFLFLLPMSPSLCLVQQHSRKYLAGIPHWLYLVL